MEWKKHTSFGKNYLRSDCGEWEIVKDGFDEDRCHLYRWSDEYKDYVIFVNSGTQRECRQRAEKENGKENT